MKQKFQPISKKFLICTRITKTDEKPAAQDVHHCAPQLWMKDKEEERIDKGVDKGHVDRNLENLDFDLNKIKQID